MESHVTHNVRCEGGCKGARGFEWYWGAYAPKNGMKELQQKTFKITKFRIKKN